MFYHRWIIDSYIEAVICFFICTLLVVAIVVVKISGGTSSETITGKVLSIEQTNSVQGEVILTLADEYRSISADGQEHIYTINRSVFFKSYEDVDGIVVGDIITVKGKPNGYSLFQGSVEK